MPRMNRTEKKGNPSHPKDSNPQPHRKRTPLWLAVLLPIAAVLLFFLLLEGGLALVGINPDHKAEDPFVGFSSNVPLFVPAPGPQGRGQLSTSENKTHIFNRQSFPRTKAPNTYRIFSLGGSTTYGRPYSDTTSFSGWLREFLPLADKSKNWEVINAGGISYASYRVAHLMEELVNYQPDLFIIYTGHNEFLEERTYRNIKDIPPAIRSTISYLAGTRTWSAMASALQSVGLTPEAKKTSRDKLSVEVNAILDRTAGLERYTRDDPLQEKILHHYRLSLERMVALARSAGAKVIFVTPASNLKDCAPFKSQHTPALNETEKKHSEEMMVQAEEAMKEQKWDQAVSLFEKAVATDPRHSKLQYLYGRSLLALGRLEEAEGAFRRAKDEDVCPLRALSPMNQIVAEVAEQQNVPLIDYVGLLEARMQETTGHRIPGEEYFLDHVHPNIEGHRILGVALVNEMARQDMLSPGSDWNDKGRDIVAAKIRSRINREDQGQALANLARVLSWAGKREEAARLATQANEIAGDYRQVAVDSASILTTVYVDKGQPERAVELLYSAIKKAPGAVELHLKLGQTLLYPPFRQYEEAAANILLACQQVPTWDGPPTLFGIAMAKSGRPEAAYLSLMEAIRLNPKNSKARTTLMQIRPLLQNRTPSPTPSHIRLEIYPSRAPRSLVQIRMDASGRPVPDGIEVEFHENGRIKRYLDIRMGTPHGLELTWNPEGQLLSRVEYRNGNRLVAKNARQAN